MKKWLLLFVLFLTPPLLAQPSPVPPEEEVITVEMERDTADLPTVTAEANAPPAPGTDWRPIIVNYILLLQGMLVPMLIAWVRIYVEKIPRILIPIVAVAFGMGSDLVATLLLNGDFDPVRGALVGVLGTFFRELWNTYRQHQFRS